MTNSDTFISETTGSGPHNGTAGPLVTGDVTAFEHAAKKIGLELSATQLSRGEPTIAVSSIILGETVLASYSSSQKLGVHFHARPSSLNFSVQAGGGAAQMDGKPRHEHSLVFYSLPGAGQFTAVIPKSEPALVQNPAIHVSLPESCAAGLGIPEAFLGKGWLELCLDEKSASDFVSWAELCLSGGAENGAALKEQLQLRLSRLLEPLRRTMSEKDLKLPGHYSRIIGLADTLVTGAPSQEPLSILGIASELRISTRTLQRAFQSIYGTSVSQYVQHRRLERARSLLLKSERPICHSARHMGFEHASRFAQQYRRLYGNLPSDTRRAG